MESSRPATAEDLPRVVDLARLLRDELGALRGGELWAVHEAFAEPLDDAYAALFARDDAHVVVGSYDGVVVGFGAMQVERLTNGERLAVVMELFVEHDAREVGVGEAIVDALIDFAREQRCVGIDALTLPGSRAAKNFFEGNHFTARALTMHRALDDTPHE